MNKLNKSSLAFYASTLLATIATLIVTPYSVGLVHQPKAPKELLNK